jgi:hypothetical protein
VLRRKRIHLINLAILIPSRPYVPPVPNTRHGLNFPSTRPPLPTIPSDAGSGQQTPRVNLPANTEIKAEGGVLLDGEDAKPRPVSVSSVRSSQAGSAEAVVGQN